MSKSIATDDTNTPLLTTTQLSCIRGDNVLFKDLNFSLATKQCLHITGANGAGKTSLLKLLCGLNQADEGHILWRGNPITSSETFAKERAYIGHKDALKSELSAIENLAFEQAIENSNDEDQLDDVLAKLQILQCADLPAQHLSFGQRRRLAFAKLLLAYKPLWVLDEPFTGIDTAGRALIEQLCVDHLEHGGLIILTHHQSLATSSLNDFTSTLSLDTFSPT